MERNPGIHITDYHTKRRQRITLHLNNEDDDILCGKANVKYWNIDTFSGVYNYKTVSDIKRDARVGHVCMKCFTVHIGKTSSHYPLLLETI